MRERREQAAGIEEMIRAAPQPKIDHRPVPWWRHDDDVSELGELARDQLRANVVAHSPSCNTPYKPRWIRLGGWCGCWR